jgi:hypothetical protein
MTGCREAKAMCKGARTVGTVPLSAADLIELSPDWMFRRDCASRVTYGFRPNR